MANQDARIPVNMTLDEKREIEAAAKDRKSVV